MRRSILFALILAAMTLYPACAETGSVPAEKGVLFPPIEDTVTGYLQVSDLHRIFYVTGGNPEGRPVMCLHGGPGAGSYPRMMQYFNPEKYHIVLHDQRGAGRSEPSGELRENNTWNLVEDIEKLRKHLDLGKVMIFGGSWGSTLAMAYAEKYPENVTAMVMRGVFLGTEEELEFHYLGTGYFFPLEHDRLLSLLPDSSRGTHPDYIYELIHGDDEALAERVLDALGRFEFKFMKLNMPDEAISNFLDSIPRKALRDSSFIDLHYVKNRYFLKDGQLLENAGKLKDIPMILINGRYDMASPPFSAYKVHKALPHSKLIIVEEAGHSESEEGITAELVKAVAEFE